MPQHQRRDIQDWLNLFEQQKQSGLTAVEFCRQQQINVQTYYTRRRDIRLQRTSSRFVQVKRKITKVESYTEETDSDLVLQLENAQLRVPTNMSPHWIATVIKALVEWRCSLSLPISICTWILSTSANRLTA